MKNHHIVAPISLKKITYGKPSTSNLKFGRERIIGEAKRQLLSVF
jgi:hypothetical protein